MLCIWCHDHTYVNHQPLYNILPYFLRIINYISPEQSVLSKLSIKNLCSSVVKTKAFFFLYVNSFQSLCLFYFFYTKNYKLLWPFPAPFNLTMTNYFNCKCNSNMKSSFPLQLYHFFKCLFYVRDGFFCNFSFSTLFRP